MLIMRKLIALLLAVSVIAGSIHMDELAKLPVLISHYNKHKSENKNSTVIGFLYDHYLSNGVQNATGDLNNHSRLPFKSAKTLQQHISLFTTESIAAILTFHPVVEISFPTREAEVVPGVSVIWQPPKIA